MFFTVLFPIRVFNKTQNENISNKSESVAKMLTRTLGSFTTFEKIEKTEFRDFQRPLGFKSSYFLLDQCDQ